MALPVSSSSPSTNLLPSNINDRATEKIIKRYKPIETCDNCKQRKVKCDKERPVCGACKRSKRECTYDFSASSKRGRPKSELEILQEQIEEIATVQFTQMDQLETMLEMAAMGTGALPPTASTSQNSVPDPQAFNLYNESFLPTAPESWPEMYQTVSLNQNLSEETLQASAMLAANLPKLKPEVTTNTNQYTGTSSTQDPMEQLTNELNNINLYESTRYIGEGSLLMQNDNGEEMIVPQAPSDLSQVEDELKVFPNEETTETLINLYYSRVYRHYPHLKKKIVLDCLRDLSKPQHFLLLNSIFFAASPFHPDKEMRDGGRQYQLRAIALLQNHCLQTPHVLTVISLFILGLNTRVMGSAWIFIGMSSKMAFELGLHRKIKKVPINDDIKEIKEMRDMAFWGCFVAETWVSATYGRPSAIDESTCDVDLLPIPSDPNPDEETKLHIAWILHINLMRIFAQVRKYLYGLSKIEGTRREENKFRFLDAALGKWFNTLPPWLRFEEMAKDVQGSLLGAIGGEMHTLFWTVLILLHSRNLTMFTSNSRLFSNRLSSQTICIHAATILLHWLDVLTNSVQDFFEQTCAALFAIAPAIRILSWTAQHGDKKAEKMVERLKEIKDVVKEISRRLFPADGGRLDGEEKLKGWFGKFKETKNTQQAQEPGLNVGYTTNKGKNRQANRRMNWNEDKDNFTFTFAVDSPINFNTPQQPIMSPQNFLQTPQLPQQSQNFSDQTYLFSTLSPPNVPSASTSPDPNASSIDLGSSSTFQSLSQQPIFDNGNTLMQQQLQDTGNVWTSPPDNKDIMGTIDPPYGGGYDIVAENDGNSVDNYRQWNS